jgi:hypothetical protein
MAQAIIINRTFVGHDGSDNLVTFTINPDCVTVSIPFGNIDVGWDWIDDADALIGNFGYWEVCLFAQMVKQLARINLKKEVWLGMLS